MAISIRCTGRVQGVYYRASTAEKANELGLNGWVKNEPDGSVLIHAEGDVNKLQKLVEWCRRGPRMAVVSDVRVQEVIDEEFDQFEIRR